MSNVSYKEVAACIDSHAEEALDFLIRICDIDSPTEYKAGVDAVGTCFLEHAEKEGWRIDVHHEPISGNAICITMNGDAPLPPVCLSGHMDTVHPIGLIKTHVEGDRLYGAGATDCKGGIAAALFAMKALKECGYTKRPVKLILQSDEESSSRHSEKRTVAFMAEMAKGCVAFLNAEGYRKGMLTTERKGIARYTFHVKGASVHASKCYDGASAILEAAHKIIRIERLRDPDGITASCGIINGGTATNTVPDTCDFTVDFRYKTSAQLEEIRAFAKEVAAHSTVAGTSCELTLDSLRIHMEKCEANEALFARICEIFAECGIDPVTPYFSTGGSDAADMTAHGITAIDSIGTSGDGIHSPGEYTLIPSIAYSAKMMAAIVLHI